MKGLLEESTREILRESFESSIGTRIATGQETGSPKGFGFIDFNSEEDTKVAKEATGDSEIDGNKVTLQWAKPTGKGGFSGRKGWIWRQRPGRLWR